MKTRWTDSPTYKQIRVGAYERAMREAQEQVSQEVNERLQQESQRRMEEGRGWMRRMSAANEREARERKQQEVLQQTLAGQERQREWDARAAAQAEVDELWTELKTPAIQRQLQAEATEALAEEGTDVASLPEDERQQLLQERIIRDRLEKEANRGNAVKAQALQNYLDQMAKQAEYGQAVQGAVDRGGITREQVEGLGYETTTQQPTRWGEFNRRATAGELQGGRLGLTREDRELYRQIEPRQTIQSREEQGPIEGAFVRAGKQITAGTGRSLAGIGGACQRFGIEAGKDIERRGREIANKALEDVDEPVGDLQQFTDATWQSMPFTLSALLTAGAITVGGPYVGLGAGAAWFWSAAWSAVTSRTFEGTVEAGQTYLEAKDRFGEEKAKDVFDEVLTKNYYLLGVDAAQMGVALTPMGKLLSAATGSKLVNTGTIGGKLSITGLTEGGEEVYQEMVQRRAMGDEFALDPRQWDEETKLAFAVGSFMGGAMGAGGHVISRIGEETRSRLDAEEDRLLGQYYDEAVEEGRNETQATTEAIARLAKESEPAANAAAEAVAVVSEPAQQATTRAQPEQAAPTEAQAAPAEQQAVSGEIQATEGIVTAEELQVGAPNTRVKKQPNGTTSRRTIVDVSVPADKRATTDRTKTEAHVFGYVPDGSLKKTAPVWSVYVGEKASSGNFIARDLTYNQAVEAAKTHLVEANTEVAPQQPTDRTMAAEAPREPSLRVRLESPDHRKEAIRYIQSEMTRLNKAKLTNIAPPKVNKLLRAIEKADGPIKVRRAIGKAQEVIDTVEQANLREKIKTNLKQAKPKKTAGVPKPKVATESQRRLNEIEAAIKKATSEGRQRALGAIADAQRKLAQGELTEEEYAAVLDDNEGAQLHLPSMSTSELQTLLNEITGTRKGGKAARKEIIQANKERRDARVREGVAIITAGKGVEGPRYTVPKKNETPWWKSPGRFWLSQYSFGDLMNMLDRRAGAVSERFKGFHSTHFGEAVQEAYHKKAELDHKYATKLDKMVFGVFGTKDRGAIDHELDSWHQIGRDGKVKNRVNLGTFTVKGERVKLELSVGEMGTIHNIAKNPDAYATFENENGMAWTTSMLEAVENTLTEKQKAFYDGLQDLLKEMADDIRPVYEADFHVPFDEVAFYWPWLRKRAPAGEKHKSWAAETPGHTSGMLVAVDTMGMSASPRNGALKQRTNNTLPFKFVDASRVFGIHVARMSHYISHAEAIKEARHYFGNPDVRDAIEQEFGEGMTAAIDDQLDNIARGSFDPEKVIDWIDTMRRRFTFSVFGGSVPILMKQLPSLIGYSTEPSVGPVNLAEGIADFLSSPVEKYQEMVENSPTTRERFGRGFNIDLQNAYKGHRGLMKSGRLADLTVVQIRAGDKIAIAAGQWAVYKAQLKRKKADGSYYSKEEAWRETERITDRTQPTFTMHSIAGIRQQGSALQAMTMYTTQLNKYFRMETNALADWHAGRQSASSALYTIFLSHIVIPNIIQLVSNAFRWDGEDQLRASILGPLNGFLVVGNFINSMVDKLAGKRWDYEPSPILSGFSNLGYGFEQLHWIMDDVKDPMERVDNEDVWRMLEDFMTAAGYFTGVPTRFGEKVAGAITEKDPRRLAFTEWQLTGGEEPPKEPKYDYFSLRD